MRTFLFAVGIVVVGVVGLVVLLPHLHPPDLELKIVALVLLAVLVACGLTLALVSLVRRRR